VTEKSAGIPAYVGKLEGAAGRALGKFIQKINPPWAPKGGVLRRGGRLSELAGELSRTGRFAKKNDRFSFPYERDVRVNRVLRRAGGDELVGRVRHMKSSPVKELRRARAEMEAAPQLRIPKTLSSKEKAREAALGKQPDPNWDSLREAIYRNRIERVRRGRRGAMAGPLPPLPPSVAESEKLRKAVSFRGEKKELPTSLEAYGLGRPKMSEKEARFSERQLKSLEKAIRDAKATYTPRRGHMTLKEPLHTRLGRKVHKGYALGRGTHYGRKGLLGDVEHLYKDRVFVSSKGRKGFGRKLTDEERARVLDLFKHKG